MIGNKELDKTLFKHIIKKVKSEKSELLKSVNREIRQKRKGWGKYPSVCVVYRMQPDKLYTEYIHNNTIRELQLSPISGILVLEIPVGDHKPLTMEQFNTIINGYFSEVKQVLLDSDSVKITDNMSLNNYFEDLKNDSINDNLGFHWFKIGELLQHYRLSISDIDGKTAAIALAYWFDIYFLNFKNNYRDITPLLEQFQLIILKSANEWSLEFVKNIQSVMFERFNKLNCAQASTVEKICVLEQIFDNIISIKKKVQRKLKQKRKHKLNYLDKWK